MKWKPSVAFLFLVAAGTAWVPASERLACNLKALSVSELDRHQVLAGKLHAALVQSRELSNGYELTFDFARLAADSKGLPFCVVELAEWVEQESRCCPFLEFGIDVAGGSRIAKLRLTGGTSVKAFLREEFSLLGAAGRSRGRAVPAWTRDPTAQPISAS